MTTRRSIAEIAVGLHTQQTTQPNEGGTTDKFRPPCAPRARHLFLFFPSAATSGYVRRPAVRAPDHPLQEKRAAEEISPFDFILLMPFHNDGEERTETTFIPSLVDASTCYTLCGCSRR